MCYPPGNLFKSSHLKTSLFLHMSPLLIFGTRSAYTTISSISSLKLFTGIQKRQRMITN